MHIYQQLNLNNEQISRTETDSVTENILIVAIWKGFLRMWMKNMKGLISTNWLLQNSHWQYNYSIWNRVNNILITMYGVSWV